MAYDWFCPSEKRLNLVKQRLLMTSASCIECSVATARRDYLMMLVTRNIFELLAAAAP